MPMIRNKINVGIPILKEVLLNTILTKSRIDPSRRIFSGVKDMCFSLNNKRKNLKTATVAATETAKFPKH
jgi:hypothetical protein